MALSGRTPAYGDDRQRVLDATDIVQLIREHVALKNKGREYVGLCPFHDDHSPSMYIVPSKQIYHCFSCGAGGNALGFVMNYHRMQFREALEHLAERAGITLTPRPTRRIGGGSEGEYGGGDAERELDRASLMKSTATACTFFRAILDHPEHGRAAREVIQRRGIAPEMVEQFQIGAAPDKWDGLVITIGSKKLALEAFRAVGLVKARDNGNGFYDGFRNRLMFPIHDQIGRVIGFGGRRINDEDEPKYINSSESALFDKSTTLYGLHQAAQAIRQSGVALVTEGYMDTIACHQAGVKNAVATLGTALTPGNARVLRRLCNEVVLLFDGDEAGQKAAERAVEVFFAEPIDVRIAMLSAHTDAKDPDELLKREGGKSVLETALKAAIDPLELLFARMRAQTAGSGLSARTRAIDDYVSRLVELGLGRVDKLRYQLVIKRLAQIADVDYQTIATMVSERRERLKPRGVAGNAGGRTAVAYFEYYPGVLGLVLADA
ncbi:MAG: DNA primase, partial [Phycisphaerales bacterium]|nr:DNA primase [Phycisphaerales bacterium]